MRYVLCAHNTSKSSDNRIHDDAVARSYGFAGGLVPGVDVYAYLVRPFVSRWGRTWLEQGVVEVTFVSPAYDGDTLAATSTDHGSETAAYIGNAPGQVCGAARGGLADSTLGPSGPVFAGVAALPDSKHGVDALPAVGEPLGPIGDVFDADKAARYLDEVRETSPIFAEERIAHPGWLLRWSNWLLKANVALGPWIHVSSAVRHHRIVEDRDPIECRGTIVEVRDHRGQRSATLDIGLWSGGRPVQQVRHTAVVRPVSRA